jgi:hypothetical protein
MQSPTRLPRYGVIHSRGSNFQISLCAPWHLATHELQQQIEEAHPISISTSTKKQWLVGAATILSTKYASFWHDLLEARTAPPAPPAAPS